MTTIHPPLFMFLIGTFGCEKKRKSYLVPSQPPCATVQHIFCLPACHMVTINPEPWYHILHFTDTFQTVEKSSIYNRLADLRRVAVNIQVSSLLQSLMWATNKRAWLNK